MTKRVCPWVASVLLRGLAAVALAMAAWPWHVPAQAGAPKVQSAAPAPAAPSAESGRAGPPAPSFGVMVHYLPDKQSAGELARFDAEALADSLAEMRASYLILTLGQNNGQYIAPNAALETLCPRSARNRAPRDLPLAIGRALQRRDIALILYLPFRAPQADPYLMECLGDVSEQLPPPPRFIAAWSAVIRDWSDHYGPLATGWWFDGVYNTTGMTADDWGKLCAAARSGASNRWLAFNAGEGQARFSLKSAPCQNLMAGEYLQPTARLVSPPSELRLHVLTPLGTHWGRPSTARFSAAQLRGWIGDATAAGGMLTLDLPLDSNFHFLPAHVALVRSATAPRP
ncbi:hypothetical protein J2W30_003365 [Variovorax boronicumulans]|uniref:hypothetical protein n=1 Tax=Variovorax boronicumulans TaxID=436515 RepID=UPI00278143FA|nr:hypothetical protein [Variovorax boronicumulans]MDP9991927.1 hypothetical protein [Variovorax boronicumulans]MDQ0001822.1 hypothetical protein [Variovorax boronicumulans]MDQ0035597.1 hypothetical protein [Variovorax boronicumulans]MDQ0040344.1 hypothetical protein [Variovorax boronicumulans]